MTEVRLILAKEYIEEAKVDLEAAKDHLKAGRYHKTVFESQQCVEKLMKAALACEGAIQVYLASKYGVK